jgi:hypothetical protein
MKSIITALYFIVSASVALADGSAIPEEFEPLLKQKKEIYEFVSAHLELDKHGSGDRIGQAVNPRLGGTRIAPFFVKAKPRGEKEWTLLLEIQAQVDFLDEEGKKSSLEEAVSIRETFTGIRLTPLEK